MQILPVRDNFPRGFYEEIGRLAVAFGRLEYLIKLCVKDLLAEGFTRGMAEAESQYQFSKLCKQAKQQADKKLIQMQAHAFSALLDQAINLADSRNDVIHALWTTNSEGMPLRIRPKWDKTTHSVDWSRSCVVRMNQFQDQRDQIEQLYTALETQRNSWSIGSLSQ